MSISSFVSQFVKVIESIDLTKPIDVLAHSWGAYIFYETVRSHFNLQFGKVILVSPVGLTRSRFDGSGERLISRIPEDVMGEVEEVMKTGSGQQLMQLIAPYYMGRVRNDVILDFKDYCANSFDEIVEVLGEFDCRNIESVFPKQAMLIYGDNDIEKPVDTDEIHEHVSVRVISDSGHFTFAEQPTEFTNIALEYLST